MMLSSPTPLLYRRLQKHRQHVHYFCSKRPSSPLEQVTEPTQRLNSWESGARLVKNTEVENQYLEHIRAIHDPSQHIKTIEDELKGTIGKALGKQGEKVNQYLRAMEQEKRAFRRLLDEEHKNYSDAVVADTIHKFNAYRKDAIQARWELIVHRQAVGFTVGNQSFIMAKFPIDDPLPTADEAIRLTELGKCGKGETSKKDEVNKFGDQLEWWQRIGRWK